jgi:glyoxylase-like metal-dependent hydrolase (beta-lactamase superfamily II)
MRTAMSAFFAVVTTCALLWTADVGQAQSPAVSSFTLKQVGSNVWAAIDNPAAKGVAAANGGFVIGAAGVAVIDSFASANAAKELLTEIRQRTKQPIRFVINTHYHGDHVGGNGVFTDAGASVVAHRNVRAWIHVENLRLIGDKAPESIKTMIQGLTKPSVLHVDGVNLYLGEREIQVRFFPGHTGGDSVVFVPDAGVAFAGDLLWRSAVPNIVDGTTPAWIATLDTLAKTNAQSTFIPGHGDVATARDVIAFRDYLGALRTLVGDVLRQGKSGAALVEAVLPTLKKNYGQWDFFAFLAEPNIRDMEAELSGKKRVPQP